MPEGFYTDRLDVLMVRGVQGSFLEERFGKVNLKVMSSLSRSENRVMFSYDPSTISYKELSKQLLALEEVQSVDLISLGPNG